MYELETKIELMSVFVDARIEFCIDDVGGIQTIYSIELIDDEGDASNVYPIFQHNKQLQEHLDEHIMDEVDNWEHAPDVY